MSGDPVLRAREETERTCELLRRSHEQIRMSLELLEHDVPGLVSRQAPPICKSCDVGMMWSRSMLDETKWAIIHIFVCPLCGERAETETRVKLLLDTVASGPDGSSGDLIP